MNERRDRHAPPGLTEEERREWWERQFARTMEEKLRKERDANLSDYDDVGWPLLADEEAGQELSAASATPYTSAVS